jgi:hypothetical protein
MDKFKLTARKLLFAVLVPAATIFDVTPTVLMSPLVTILPKPSPILPDESAPVASRLLPRLSVVKILPDSSGNVIVVGAWEKQVLSARGFKRVGSHSEYAI